MRIDLLEQWLKMFPYGYCAEKEGGVRKWRI